MFDIVSSLLCSYDGVELKMMKIEKRTKPKQSHKKVS
jgi:hypothetical protein